MPSSHQKSSDHPATTTYGWEMDDSLETPCEVQESPKDECGTHSEKDSGKPSFILNTK